MNACYIKQLTNVNPANARKYNMTCKEDICSVITYVTVCMYVHALNELQVLNEYQSHWGIKQW